MKPDKYGSQSFLPAVGREIKEGDFARRVIIIFLGLSFYSVDFLLLSAEYHFRNIFSWWVLLLLVLLGVVHIFVSFVLSHVFTDLLFSRTVPLKKVVSFHIKYMFLPLVVIYIITPFTEKEVYIDKKADQKMEMKYTPLEGIKKW